MDRIYNNNTYDELTPNASTCAQSTPGIRNAMDGIYNGRWCYKNVTMMNRPNTSRAQRSTSGRSKDRRRKNPKPHTPPTRACSSSVNFFIAMPGACGLLKRKKKSSQLHKMKSHQGINSFTVRNKDFTHIKLWSIPIETRESMRERSSNLQLAWTRSLGQKLTHPTTDSWYPPWTDLPPQVTQAAQQHEVWIVRYHLGTGLSTHTPVPNFIPQGKTTSGTPT
jgi:hypothetical protein